MSTAEHTLRLTLAELDLLVVTARYYERAMGPTRHLVRLTAPREVKSKYAFVQEESTWLQRFAETERERARAQGVDSIPVTFTIRALIAFWGRLLSNLQSPRSRRRLSKEGLVAREQLAERVRVALLDVRRTAPQVVDAEILTRRSREVPWMHAALGVGREDQSGPQKQGRVE